MNALAVVIFTNGDGLESHPSNATRSIPQPAQWTKSGSYPTIDTVNYDATAKEFRITLGGLAKR